MTGAMAQDTTALERAFQLARSGEYASINDIKRRLRTEGFTSEQVSGSALLEQLRTLIRTAREKA